VVFTALSAAVALRFDFEPRLETGLVLHLLAKVSVGIGMAAIWGQVIFLGRKTMPHEKVRWWVMAAALPVIWMALGVICVAVIPAVMLYVLVAVRSLMG